MGWSRRVEKNALLKEVNRSGAVSPATRASATRMPVTMPGSAAGRITVHTARERREAAERHHGHGVGEDPDHDGGDAVEDVGGEPHGGPDAAALVFGQE